VSADNQGLASRLPDPPGAWPVCSGRVNSRGGSGSGEGRPFATAQGFRRCLTSTPSTTGPTT